MEVYDATIGSRAVGSRTGLGVIAPGLDSSDNIEMLGFFLPECRQRCCLLQRRRLLTGLAQLLLAGGYRPEGGAAEQPTVCPEMQPVCSLPAC